MGASRESLERRVEKLEAEVARLKALISAVAPHLLEEWKSPSGASVELRQRGIICSAQTLRRRIRDDRLSRQPHLEEGVHYQIKEGGRGGRVRYTINVNKIAERL